MVLVLQSSTAVFPIEGCGKPEQSQIQETKTLVCLTAGNVHEEVNSASSALLVCLQVIPHAKHFVPDCTQIHVSMSRNRLPVGTPVLLNVTDSFDTLRLFIISKLYTLYIYNIVYVPLRGTGYL